MIGYFPEPYPDELVYSLLARYCAKSGYLGYVCAAKEIFQNTWNLPNIEFLNEYKPEVYQRLEKNTGMRHIVMEHTMFPVYGRFLPQERRRAAYNALLLGKGNYHNLLPQNKWKKNDRYLRYCPVCIKADREKYGETYWHRMHQIYGMNICPKHLCMLYESNVPIKSKATPSLLTAEESYSEQCIEYSEISSERNLATYVHAMMKQPVDLLSEGTAGDYLQSVIAESEYSSPRGEHRYMSKLFSDFEQYYTGLPGNRMIKPWTMQKLLCNKRISFVEICMVAHFLKVMPVDLAAMKVPEISHKDAFDAKVRELHDQGLKYPEIARRMNASLDVVKPVGEGRYPKGDPNKVRVNRGGVKSYNWEKIDLEMLPAVQEAVKKVWGIADERPRRVNTRSVAKVLEYPVQRFDNMPLCRAEIEKYCETQEQYWAREMIWAAKQVLASGKSLNYTALEKLTNIRKADMRSCMVFFDDHTEDKFISMIREILE